MRASYSQIELLKDRAKSQMDPGNYYPGIRKSIDDHLEGFYSKTNRATNSLINLKATVSFD